MTTIETALTTEGTELTEKKKKKKKKKKKDKDKEKKVLIQ